MSAEELSARSTVSRVTALEDRLALLERLFAALQTDHMSVDAMVRFIVKARDGATVEDMGLVNMRQRLIMSAVVRAYHIDLGVASSLIELAKRVPTEMIAADMEPPAPVMIDDGGRCSVPADALRAQTPPTRPQATETMPLGVSSAAPSAEAAAVAPSAEAAAVAPSAEAAAVAPSAEATAATPSAEATAVAPSAEAASLRPQSAPVLEERYKRKRVASEELGAVRASKVGKR